MKKACVSWSVGGVVSYLDRISLGCLAESFRANGVDGSFLQTLSEEDLMKELGLTTMQARTVKDWLP